MVGSLLSLVLSEKAAVEDAGNAFRRHYAQIYRFLRRRTGSDDVAEELAQTVFADAAAGLEQFKPGATPVLAWLYTVAQRRLVDRARASARTMETLALLEASRAHVVEDVDYGTDVARAIREAIEHLPPLQREVVLMKLFEGRRFAEIAARVGATEAACKMRFARGLEAMRDELRQKGVEPQ